MAQDVTRLYEIWKEYDQNMKFRKPPTLSRFYVHKSWGLSKDDRSFVCQHDPLLNTFCQCTKQQEHVPREMQCFPLHYLDGLAQKRRISIANDLVLRLFCI